MATSPVIERLATLKELAGLADEAPDADKVTITRALLFPLLGDSRRELRLGIMAILQSLIKNTKQESKKVSSFNCTVIVGLVFKLVPL